MPKRQAVAPLGNLNALAEAYSPPEQFFISDQVCPRVSVDSTRFAFLRYTTIRQRILNNITRAPGSDVNTVEWDVTEDTGMTTEKAVQSPIDRKTVRDFSRAIAEQRAVQAVRDQILIQNENLVVSLLQTVGNYPSASYYTDLSAATDKWDDLENSDPEDDVRTGIEQILTAASITANTIIIPFQVANKLAQHPVIKDVLIRDGRGSSSEAFGMNERAGLPADLFGLRVIVPKVTYVSSNPGQTEAQSYLWGKHVWVGYVTSAPSVDSPSFAYNFTSLAPQYGMGDSGEAGGGEYVEGYEDNLHKIVGQRMGYLIQNVVN